MEEFTASPVSSKRASTSRSSGDLHANPSSPHHHSLHFRFRTTSNASHTDPSLSPGPAPAPSDKVVKSEAVKSAKCFLLATVRDNWEYPSAEAVAQEEDTSFREPTGYGCREEGASDLELEETGGSRPGIFSSKENNPYRFENPDAVATSIIDRKRKRRRLFEEEMLWNEGLRIWSQRRDAWTKAVSKRPTHRKPSPQLQEKGNSQSSRNRFASDSTDLSSNWPLTSASASSSDPSDPSSSSIDSVDIVNGLASELDGPWLPIFPPIIPADNVVRANIKPSAYNTIYSKVVIQSLTPSVPIPLSHMTFALVEGWKTDGAWPPPTSVAATAVLRESKKKTSALLNVMRMRRTNGHGHQAHNHGREGLGAGEKPNEKMKKGLGAVKKALGVPPGSGDEFGLDFEEAEDAKGMDANEVLNKGPLDGT